MPKSKMKRLPKQCEVCHEWCNSRLEWFHHFFQAVHLEKMSEDGRLIDPDIMKSCSVLISGQFPLEGMQILDYFSKGKKHIRNYVWNPDRRRLAVIQFESSESVDKLMKEIKESHVWVGGDRIEVKRNYDLGFLKVRARPPMPSTSRMFSSAKAMARDGASSDSDCSVEGVKVKRTPAPASSKLKLASVIPKTKLSEPHHLLPFSKEDGLTVPLVSSQFATIQSEVEIPEVEFNTILNLLQRLQKIVIAKNPMAKFTTLFRHKYLKLRDAGSNHLLIYLSQFQYRPLPLSFFDVEKLFVGSQFQPLGHDHVALSTVECGYPYLDKETGLKFGLVFHHDHEGEVVTCQLVRYLISFDPKARSLLTLIHYWARENDIILSEKGILRKNQGSNIPDPAALEWLCLFYLTEEGIIPSLKEMRKDARENERNSVIIEGTKNSTISFPRDAQFRREWQQAKIKYYTTKIDNKYVVDVLELTLGFFNFCSKNDFKGKVLKTMEGKMVELLPAIEDGLISESINPDLFGDPEELRRQAKKLEDELNGEMYLMQPFVPTRSFKVDQKKFDNHVVPIMKKTAKKLEFYLGNGQRNKSDGKVMEVDLKSLFQYGKLEVVYGVLKENAENDNNIQLEEQQKRNNQEKVGDQDKQKMHLEVRKQIKLLKEQKQNLLDDQLLEEEHQRKKLLKEYQWKKFLEEMEHQRKKLIEEHQLKKLQEENQQKKLLEEQQRKKLLEEQQQKKLLEEQHRKKLLEEQQQKKLLEEQQRKKLVEEQQQKKLLEEQQHKKQLETQQQKQKTLEVQRQKKLLEIQQEQQKKQVEVHKEKRTSNVIQSNAKPQLSEPSPIAKAKETPKPLNKSDSISLLQFFNALSDEVTMPTKTWDALVEFRKALSVFFSSCEYPECKLVLFRNRYLKLYYEGVEANIFLFLDHPGLYTIENGTRQALIPKSLEIQRFIDRVQNDAQYSEQMKQLLVAAMEKVPSPAIGTRLEHQIFTYEGTDFHIATRCFLPELQACRLVEYMSTTDPRVIPVMKVIYYWAKVNGIRLGKVSPDQVGVAPDPALLEWLVIFFLSEKQIIPALSEVCGSKVDEGLFFDGVDIGFKGDPESAWELWDRYEDGEGEQHILNVLELARDFFQYWSDFGLKAEKKPVVINLRNGHVFLKDEVKKNSNDMRSLSWATGISLPELKNLHLEPEIMKSFYDIEEPVTILHPLYIKYCFSFCAKAFVQSICPKMKVVHGQLRELLRACKGCGDERAIWNIEKVFKVES
ncbi:unnamed protein product [Orchesella dallaii]|uniref:Uncharacterized protein n=1 Tax=Orchesella dallaii TaxID=48710 RepID=A0ABP1RMP4_9HEXA